MTTHARFWSPGRIFVFAILAVGAAVNLVPFLWTLSTSLKTPTEVFAYPPTLLPDPVAWGNYLDAFRQVNPRVFLNSAIFAGSIVILQGIITMMGGFAFARLRFPFRNQLFLAYLATMMVPTQVTMIPTFIIVVNLGWVDSYSGLIIPILAQGAFGTFMFRQFFSKIPNELFEAARLDGANPWQLFWRLTVPLSRPVMTAYGVITFLTAWNMYLWPLIVVRTPELKVVPMAIAELSGGYSQDRGVEMAAVSLSVLPVLVLWIIGQRWFVEGISMTGMKG
jgi:ABC-type glycerol-3-phosphate transport system permease component